MLKSATKSGTKADKGELTALLSIILLATETRGGKWWPSRCNVLYTSPMYARSCRPSVAPAQDWMSSRIMDLTSALTAPGPTAWRRDTRLSMNSREAISVKKCEPPFLTQVSVSCVGESATTRQLGGGILRGGR